MILLEFQPILQLILKENCYFIYILAIRISKEDYFTQFFE